MINKFLINILFVELKYSPYASDQFSAFHEMHLPGVVIPDPNCLPGFVPRFISMWLSQFSPGVWRDQHPVFFVQERGLRLGYDRISTLGAAMVTPDVRSIHWLSVKK